MSTKKVLDLISNPEMRKKLEDEQRAITLEDAPASPELAQASFEAVMQEDDADHIPELCTRISSLVMDMERENKIPRLAVVTSLLWVAARLAQIDVEKPLLFSSIAREALSELLERERPENSPNAQVLQLLKSINDKDGHFGLPLIISDNAEENAQSIEDSITKMKDALGMPDNVADALRDAMTGITEQVRNGELPDAGGAKVELNADGGVETVTPMSTEELGRQLVEAAAEGMDSEGMTSEVEQAISESKSATRH